MICEWRTLFGCVRAEVVFADTCTPFREGTKSFIFYVAEIEKFYSENLYYSPFVARYLPLLYL